MNNTTMYFRRAVIFQVFSTVAFWSGAPMMAQECRLRAIYNLAKGFEALAIELTPPAIPSPS
jgi:hypothetical protein